MKACSSATHSVSKAYTVRICVCVCVCIPLSLAAEDSNVYCIRANLHVFVCSAD